METLAGSFMDMQWLVAGIIPLLYEVLMSPFKNLGINEAGMGLLLL